MKRKVLLSPLLIIVLIVLFGVGIAGAAIYFGGVGSSGDVSLQKGLVGWWKFDGNTNDSTPNGNNGTLTGNPVLTTDRKGQANKAYNFDGTTDYINVADANSLDITNAITISAWAKDPPIDNIIKAHQVNEINEVNQKIDLKNLDWTNDKVGLELDSPPLPENVKVWGTPIPGRQASFLSPDGRISYIPPNSDTPLFTFYPRVAMNGQATNIKSARRHTSYSEIQNKKSIGHSGTFGNNIQYSMEQWTAENRDDFGLKVSFTSPVDLPAFSYEIVFIPAVNINGIRIIQNPSYNTFVVTDYPLEKTTSVDFASDSAHQIIFLNGKDRVGEYSFHDLYERALSAYWKIEDGAVVIGFRFPGLKAGEIFNNDGYFGISEGDYTQSNEGINTLLGARFQNTVGTGTITQIERYFIDTTPNGSTRLGVYSDSSGEPDALLVDAGATAVVNGWSVISGLSVDVTLNSYYWIAGVQDALNDTRYDLNYAAGCQAYNTLTYGALPASFGAHNNGNNAILSRAYVAIPKTIAGKGDDAYSLKMTGSTLSGYINSTAVTASVATPLAWHHYVLTYDGSQQILYIDGVQAGASDASGAIAVNATDLKIGESFSGPIDDVRIYNRALSSAEITALYESYDPSVQISDLQKGLIGQWKFNGNAKDSTPYGNNGTMAGVGGPVLTTDRKGQANKAYNFNGTTDYINVTDANSLDITSAITIAAWAKDPPIEDPKPQVPRYYFLSPMIGTGTGDDPYRPLASQYAETWGMIDLREDVTKPDGFAAVYIDTDKPPDDPKLVFLGDSLQSDIGQKKTEISDSLNKSIQGATISEMIVGLMLDKVEPMKDGKKRIYFGEQIYGDPEPTYSHTTIYEDFDGADKAVPGYDLTWEEWDAELDVALQQIWSNASNRAVGGGQWTGWNVVSPTNQMATDDHYAQANYNWSHNSNQQYDGIIIRAQDSPRYWYGAAADTQSVSDHYLYKAVSGVYTQIANNGTDPTANENLYISADGSTVTMKVNDIQIAQVTDTGVVGYTGVGLQSYSNYALNWGYFDNFQASDLVIATGKTIAGKGRDAYSLEMSADGSILYGFINGADIAALVATPLQWHNYAFTYDGSQRVLYIDGVQSASATASGAITANATDLKIGDAFSGPIDDVRIYNRALSATEITALSDSYDGGVAVSDFQKGLKGQWKFDGNAKDSTPYGNNGIVTDAVLTTDRKGQANKAYSFDGASNHIATGNAGSGIKTVSFWIQADATASKKIIDIDGTDQIETNVSSNVVATSFPAATVYIDGSSSSANLPDTNWHFVTVTDTTGVNASAMDIGAVSTSYFDGKIDDVRIYNRTLSQTEITALYESY